MRRLREIQADIAAAAVTLAALEKERDEARAVRQLGIVADLRSMRRDAPTTHATRAAMESLVTSQRWGKWSVRVSSALANA